MPTLDPCVIWNRHIDKRGYGKCTFRGKQGFPAHRAAWIRVHGEIPDGMTVDHTCFTTACVNPAHLRLLTRSENSLNQRSALKTHCKRGHEYTPANTRFRRDSGHGKRECRACQSSRARLHRASKRAAA